MGPLYPHGPPAPSPASRRGGAGYCLLPTAYCLLHKENTDMPAKDLIFQESARRQLKQGIDALAQAVRVTLGPRGRNVAIDKKWGPPTVTHDGVTVAKEIELPEHFQNMGAQLLKQAATKTNDVAGDGTTTATILAQAIVTGGLRNLAAGANPLG